MSRAAPPARGRAASHPLVIAHRGASALAPENTAAAVRLALRARADAIECDVQLSRDGVPIVFHDDDLARLCGERGRIATRTAAALVKLRVSVPGRSGRPDRVLTLARWLRLIPDSARDASGHGAVLPVVELKRQPSATAEERLARAAIELLARRHAPVAVISFSRRMVALAQALLPSARVGLVVDHWPRGPRTGGRRLGGAQPLVALDRKLATAARVAALTAAGTSVWCWTVDAPAQMRKLVARGVAGIITNRPDVARKALRR